MLKTTLSTAALVSATLLATAANNTASARDQLRIVGSSTVFPFATAVAERFGKTSGFKTPVVESTGSGGGLKLFCAGIGAGHPDIANASRRIKSSEVERCGKNGISSIVPLKKLVNLEWLNLIRNNISNITTLAQMVELRWLALNFNQIRNLKPLTELKNLEVLMLTGNPKLDASEVENLKEMLPNCSVEY